MQSQQSKNSVSVTYRRSYRRCFRRAAPPTELSAPIIGLHYMPFTHSVERWYA